MSKLLTLFLFASLLAATAHASQCPSHFVAGKQPVFVNQALSRKSQELCYEAFAVMHSGVTRTPLWSAEHLQRKNLERAQELSRENRFHPENDLPAAQRAELGDYARTGFDRGHLSPNGDMPTRNAQYESFSLANMIPQNPDSNRNIWEGIEASVRRLAKTEGDLYVVTGPAFLGRDLKKIGNVMVPTHVYKVLYSPKQHKAGAYFVANDGTQTYSAMSVAQLEKTIGINVLPGMPRDAREVAMDLPKPAPHSEGHGRKKQARKPAEESTVQRIYTILAAIIGMIYKIIKHSIKG
ncbi:DNA/RNA non-specific endonuclease [Undibacterium sp.]|uniref:DNA/RNA non-specific endonuclease n=1 Tax=Undibacterium sp. TaxID=1914977 RepID=UPI002C06B2DA|nr:DNA/RNA non-specific endonuclease [Undibacterium sp.]HTD06530.1 DNA/RNA non-specific endonuclease [Undibacterium sp.]